MPRWLEEGHRLTPSCSSDLDDLERAAAWLPVAPVLRQSRLLASPPFRGTPESYDPARVKEPWGVEPVTIPDVREDQAPQAVDAQPASAGPDQ